jgi:hypothetical protein
MATHRLVEPLSIDLPALIALSLEKHAVPVTTRFWIHSADSGQWKVVIVSPLVDMVGTRETFSRMFDALKNEDFATKQFLNSNILLLGGQESKEALDAMAKGVSRLPNLGPYEDVEVYQVAEATDIDKQGFLHLQPSGESSLVSFGPIDGGGFMKRRSMSKSELEVFLSRLPASETERSQVLDDLKQGRSTSLLTKIDLKTLYDLRLV